MDQEYYSAESYDAMALIILASQAARSTDRAAIQAEVLNVANAPGVQNVMLVSLGECLKMDFWRYSRLTMLVLLV